MSDKLKDEELNYVSGGTAILNEDEDVHKTEFELAWNKIAKKFSAEELTGNKKAAIYDEWEMADFKPAAEFFISTRI
ncbi:MAG: hypothetical protein K6A23_01555 [Butyrivibrio sp.]|nr:hypothetical protein [Butyrivibrio sp.]